MSAALFPGGTHGLISFMFSVFLVIIGTFAANDWNQPCTSGMCQYDLDSSRSSSSGTLKIWGPDTAISDITPAAGWHILGCDEYALEQEIRLICTSPSARCSHLFSDAGPKDKVVRLPERCGPNPFARVAEASISADQSLPHKLAAMLWKRDGEVPPVHALRLDTNFHEIDFAGVEPIRFAIQAVTIPDMKHDIDTHAVIDERSRRLVTRSHNDIVTRSIESIKESIVNHVDKVGSEVDSAEANIEKNAKKVIETTKLGVQKVVKEATETFTKSKIIKFGPTHFDRNVTLFQETINCPPLYPGLQITLNPDIRAHGTIGIVVVGTIVPPHVADFNTVTNLSADVNAILTLSADVAAMLDTGRIPIFEIGLPGMDFPGILSLGPKFQISVQSRLTLDLSIGARIGISYHVKNALIYYPQGPGRRSSVQSFGMKNSPLHLSATPFVQAFGQLEGKLIPAITLGLTVFKELLDIAIRAESTILTNIQLEGDGKTRAIKRRGLTKFDFDKRDINVIRQTTGVGATPTINRPDIQGRTPSKTSAVVKRSRTSPALRRRGGGGAERPGPQPTAGGRSAPTGMNSKQGPAFRGCVRVNFQFEFNAGTDTELFGLDRNSKYSFYKHTRPLWEKCFGPPPWRKIRGMLNSLAPPHISRREHSSLVKRGSRLRCLSTSISAAEALISDNSNIQLSSTRPLKAKL